MAKKAHSTNVSGPKRDFKLSRRLEKHVATWKACTLCPLHKQAQHHVLYRGSIPATTLLIGEAPGSTEDLVGEPFIGRAGKLLDHLLDDLSIRLLADGKVVAHRELGSRCIVNVLACAPWEDFKSRSVRAPSKEEAAACRPRVEELFDLIQPSRVILLGKTAAKLVPKRLTEGSPVIGMPTRLVVEVVHPAFLLRKGGTESLDYKRCLLHLKDFFSAPCVAPF